MPRALKLAVPGLSGQEAVTLILDRVACCSEDEVPGLIAALQSILSINERPAEAIVAEHINPTV